VQWTGRRERSKPTEMGNKMERTCIAIWRRKKEKGQRKESYRENIPTGAITLKKNLYAQEPEGKKKGGRRKKIIKESTSTLGFVNGIPRGGGERPFSLRNP